MKRFVRLAVAALIGTGLGVGVQQYSSAAASDSAPIGKLKLASRDSLPSLGGSSIPLLAGDSAVLLVFADAHCPVSRLRGREFIAIARAAEGTGIAFRVVIANQGDAAAQFGRLIGAEQEVLQDTSGSLFRRLNIRSVPRFVVVSPSGRLVAEHRREITSEAIIGSVGSR